MAHELRTPLNSIIPLIKKLEEDHSLDSLKRKYLRIILSSAYHLHHLIEDSLDMTKFDNKKLEVFMDYFDVRKAVCDVTQIMEF